MHQGGQGQLCTSFKAACWPTGLGCPCRRLLSPEDADRAKRIKRGPALEPKELKALDDKKLKGALKRTEAVFQQAQKKAIKVNEWLLPSDAGYLEAEGAGDVYA